MFLINDENGWLMKEKGIFTEGVLRIQSECEALA
jgi:hypothetical protein